MDWHKYLWSFGLVGLVMAGFQGSREPQMDPGEELARTYCSTCHEFPQPEILTRKSWDYLLTDMGFRLGIVDYSFLSGSSPLTFFSLSARQEILHAGGLIPAQPLLTEEEWLAIRQYYREQAPEQPLLPSEKPSIRDELPLFKIKTPSYQPREALITMIRIQGPQGRILLANQQDQTLIAMDQDLQNYQTFPAFPLIVDEQVRGDSLYLLSIGDLMGQHVGEFSGELLLFSSEEEAQLIPVDPGLHRPADMEFADLDGDGREEMIVCNFGDVAGEVSIYAPTDHGFAQQISLIQAPGAVKSHVHDFNADGLLDIAVLLGDARENISFFMNRGNGGFERKTVIETHAAYGHTYFELQDFNGDDYMDLLVVNGDTDADPFNTLKSYHGIRIYLNDGQNNFQLGYFYPMYGAHFAKAWDFDEDGDLDVAASSFFPDFSSERPEQFTYLENQGDLNFTPYTHPETFNGRWMTLDIGDYDQDGDMDIALGGGYISLGMAIEYPQKLNELRRRGKAVLLLENQLKP